MVMETPEGDCDVEWFHILGLFCMPLHDGHRSARFSCHQPRSRRASRKLSIC